VSDTDPAAAERDAPWARILVVEDRHEDGLLLEYLLSNVGYDARLAKTARAAAEIAEDWRPDLVVLDLKIPYDSGQSPEFSVGVELSRRLKASRKELPTIGLSAYGPTDDEKLHLDAYFDKPPSLGALLTAIESALPLEKTLPSPWA
jgi:CheY-like chemotaxis protein